MTPIPLGIMTILRQCGAHLMPENTLVANVVATQPRATRSDTLAALRGLEEKMMVLSVPDRLDGTPRWRLTDIGEATLRERGL